ncbi:MAG: IS5/IS1182 family transposase, partial [Thermoplasmata archaeon]
AVRGVGAEDIFLAVKKYGENTVLRSKESLIAEEYQRFWGYDIIKCYAESKGGVI